MNKPEVVAVLRQQSVFTGRILHGVDELVRFPSGRVFHHLTIQHPGAVLILPQANDKQIIAILQYRHAVRQMVLEFPAGTLEPGESPLAGAKRELTEEVGRTAAQWQSLGEFLPAPGFCNEVQYGFFATQLSLCATQHDEDELIKVVTLTHQEVDDAICDGRMKDGKSIALWMRAKLLGLLDP